MKKKYTGRLTFLINLSLFIFLMGSQCSAKIDIGKSDSLKDSFALSGKVVKREEVWDRRTNPLMGRPDFLKEIIFHIQIISVICGDAPKDLAIITASVKDQKMLIKFKGISKDQNGIFTLQGNNMPFDLINFEPFPGKTVDVVINKDSDSLVTKDEKRSKKKVYLKMIL